MKDNETRMRTILVAVVAVGLCIAAAAPAAVTYLPAMPGGTGNTVRTSDSDPSAWTNYPTSRVNTDNLWGNAAGQTNTMDSLTFLHWESNGGENSPVVTTSVTGLPQGDYDVFLLYVERENNQPTSFDIKGKLPTQTGFTLYNGLTGILEDTNSNGHKARRGRLGTLRDVTAISVDVDDTKLSGESTERSRYLGIAYEPVAPLVHPGTDYETAVLNDSPAAYWRLNETSGTTATDVAGGHTGTYAGNPALGQLGAQPPAFGGLPGNLAPRFDGSGDGVVATGANAVSFGAGGEYSVELFFQASYDELGGTNDLFSAASGGHGVLLEVDNASGKRRLRFLHRAPTGSSGGQNIYFHLPDEGDPFYDTFHHLVGVKEDGPEGMMLYLDGVPIGSTTATGGFSAPMGIAIGRISPTDSSRDFNGLLDEVAIYDYALTRAQVEGHFLAATEPVSTGDIPEPATLALLGLAVAGLGRYTRRRRA